MKKAHSTLLKRFLQWLLWMSPFFFPLYLLRFQVAGIPFTVLEVFTYLLFGAFVLALILKQIKWRESKILYAGYIFGGLLVVGAFLSAFFSETDFITLSRELLNTQRVSLGLWKGWVFAPFLYFLVLTQRINASKSLRLIFLNFIYSAAIISLIAYGLGIFAEGFTDDLRLAGLFESANYLALYLGPALLLSGYFLFQKKELTGSHRWLNLFSFAIVLHALVMTQSYGAILSLFGAIGFYVLGLIVGHRKKMKTLIWGIVSLGCVFVILIISQWNSPKFQQFLDWESRSSSSVRIELYQVSSHMIAERPVLGVGPGLFEYYYQFKAPTVLDWAPLEWNMPHPHNIFLGFWLSAGIMGLFALFGFIVLAHQKFTYPLLAFWGILIHGLFDMPFWKNDLAMIFFLIIGGIVILLNLEKKPNS